MIKKTTPLQFYLDPETQILHKDLKHWVSDDEAKKRYDTHNNDADDFKYIEYHKRIFDEFIGIYMHEGTILDYGCGEGLIQKHFIPGLFGFDLYYHNDQKLLTQTYDTIICIEVVEHFKDPIPEFKRLTELLKPGGRLLIQTQFYPELDKVPSWWYVRDITHVCFYQFVSFEYLSKLLGLTIIYSDYKSRIVLEKRQ
ncbi:class I SAM-dependent methyltransferase [Acholeplasma vituli]|uniref:Class I SAM-dependent methyltransferase n=1 Tax=Paracholeplasma vituli TaxID=69473 RepID=A0ABT2PX74_9MOLU|nr:class I SAM-dependent methyltransferase [Paracholeplasma vituli]MCU0105046.1 class I SAM-dependent methyltransferase [Paracholeplasma vituli]